VNPGYEFFDLGDHLRYICPRCEEFFDETPASIRDVTAMACPFCGAFAGIRPKNMRSNYQVDPEEEGLEE